ncbi:hypothetical protein [Listeria booriae]|uniref:hypothetical protein n=1 Tax=Listeria booriae TaxID=1552123 RepID=UPI0016250C5C|nr:hypothetical protein [Listeria booriae]MBC1290541.1 hypothetical protein [Listeria booriae]
MSEIYELYHEAHCDDYWGDGIEYYEPERIGLFSNRADAEAVRDIINYEGLAIRNLTELVASDAETFIADNYYFDYSQEVLICKRASEYIIEVEDKDLSVCDKTYSLFTDIQVTFPHGSHTRIALKCRVENKNEINPYINDFEQRLSQARFFIKQVNEASAKGKPIAARKIKTGITTIFKTR